MRLGIEALLADKKLLKILRGRKIGLICHPASVNSKLQHSVDLLHEKVGLHAAFGPQHGVKGDKQYNMIETEDIIDPKYKIPIFSLYGKVRKPTDQMLEGLDTLVFDLQDVGCRIYTFITTLLYVMEAAAKKNIEVWVLDRPNPIGREVEGLMLEPGHESFVGAAPIPMRHGLTVAELANYYKAHFNLNVELRVVKMTGYKPTQKTGFGWPSDRAWVNPSPNAPTLNMARVYPGSVMVEGTTLSEGRGTTRSLEVVGAPDLDFGKLLSDMHEMAPQWLRGAMLRECFFEPTFYKHKDKLCHGFQIHTDFGDYKPQLFKPYRIFALLFKAIRLHDAQYPLFRDFQYEYTENRLAFDVIAGTKKLKQWIDDPTAKPKDLEATLKKDEAQWAKRRKEFILYN